MYAMMKILHRTYLHQTLRCNYVFGTMTPLNGCHFCVIVAFCGHSHN